MITRTVTLLACAVARSYTHGIAYCPNVCCEHLTCTIALLKSSACVWPSSTCLSERWAVLRQAALQQMHELQKHNKAALMEIERLHHSTDAHKVQLEQVPASFIQTNISEICTKPTLCILH